MKVQDIFEAQGDIGVVLSASDGQFYDIAFVDYDTLEPIHGHYENLARHFIQTVSDHDMWEDLIPFFRKHFQAKPLGDEYSSENATFSLFGPLTDRDMNMLEDTFMSEVGV